ncbi:MAG TPA: biotin synthase BioB [Desulfobacteria bacterium]|nr:biotin synthase BioB [Desulfobacteria bacterium]
MHRLIAELAEKVLQGGEISREEALSLEKAEGADVYILMAYAGKIRAAFCGGRVDLCSITSARTGGCRENCAFCAQSAHHATGLKVETNFDEASIVAKAKEIERSGSHHFDIVTSGRGYQLNDPEFQKILRIYRRLRRELTIPLCACLGVIGEAEAQALKEAGVTRYNHNLETAASFFPQIVKTHTYAEREATIKAVKQTGMEVCCGGILGMGESPAQRVELAFALKKLAVETVSLNILNPIQGTPLAGMKRLSPHEIIKNLATFRFVLPHQIIRLSGGREANLRSLQPLGLIAGVNGMLIGNYLTTKGQGKAADLAMLDDLGLEY